MPSIPILPRAMPLASGCKDNQFLVIDLPSSLLDTATNTHPMSITCHPAGFVQQFSREAVIARGNSLEQTSGILGKLRRIILLHR